jgi:hypothetical protein
MSTLTFKKNQAIPLHTLPFVGKSKSKGMLSCWKVPATGGYGGGVLTGESLAKIYIKHLSENAANRGAATLPIVVLDMLGHDPFNATPEEVTLKGQIVGFFTEIERWLMPSAVLLKDEINNIDNKTLLKSANKGLFESVAA